jgi:hypothetical protein
MAKKKSKRPNLSQETLERARAELRGERAEPAGAVESAPSNGGTVVAARPRATTKRTTGSSLATRRIPSTSELIQEYSYVLRDLRNLAILAALLMLAIVVAAVVMPRPTG